MGGAAPWASRDLNRVWLPAKQRGQRTLSLLPALGRGRSGLEGQQVEGFCSLWVGGRQKLRNGARPGPPALRACPCICPSLHQPSCRLRTGRWLDPEVSPYPSVSLLVRYELGGSCSCNFQTPRTRSGCDRSIQGTWSLAPLDRLEGGAFGQAPSPDWLRRPSQGASILDLAGGLGGQDVVSAFRARSVLHGPQLGPSVPGPRLSLRHCPPAQQKQRQPSGCSFCLLELSSFMGDSAPPPQLAEPPGGCFAQLCRALKAPETQPEPQEQPHTPNAGKALAPPPRQCPPNPHKQLSWQGPILAFAWAVAAEVLFHFHPFMTSINLSRKKNLENVGGLCSRLMEMNTCVKKREFVHVVAVKGCFPHVCHGLCMAVAASCSAPECLSP